MSGNPNDTVVAFYRIVEGYPTIYVGRLHSHQFSKLSTGDYPNVSPSGKYVAYNPEGDRRFENRHGMPPVLVKEVASGKEIRFPSVPADTAPCPGSTWSNDETLITFDVHDFEGNRIKAVVNLLNGSFWRGTEQEFNTKYADLFPSQIRVESIRVLKSDPGYYSWAGHAVFCQRANGDEVRITPKEMWVFNLFGRPIWIEKTQEVLLSGVWHSELQTTGPMEERTSPTPTMFLVNPATKDWSHASKEEWQASAIFDAEDASCSR